MKFTQRFAPYHEILRMRGRRRASLRNEFHGCHTFIILVLVGAIGLILSASAKQST